MSPSNPSISPALSPTDEQDPSQREIQWREYALHADIYKFHVDSTIKINGFVFLVTGGVMSYVLNASQNSPPIAKFALTLPILLSFGLAFVMVTATKTTQERKEEVEKLRKVLGLNSAMNLTLLQLITASFAAVHAVVGIGLIVAMVWMLTGHSWGVANPGK